MPSLAALRAFEATARHLSFAKAAVELHVTPAAISHQVKALEDALRVKLIERKVRSIQLTPKGQELFPQLHEGFRSIRSAVDQVSRRADKKVLVVSATPGFTAKWLVPRLYRFLEANPDLEVRVSASIDFSDVLTDGVDVGLRLSDGAHPGLFVERLMTERIVPLCSPKLLQPPLDLRSAADLTRFNLIHIDIPFANPQILPRWSEWLRRVNVATTDHSKSLRFSATEHALEAAANGSGVVLGYKVMASDDIRTGRLTIPFGPEIRVLDRSYHMVCARGREKTDKILRFRNWLAHEISAAGLVLD